MYRNYVGCALFRHKVGIDSQSEPEPGCSESAVRRERRFVDKERSTAVGSKLSDPAGFFGRMVPVPVLPLAQRTFLRRRALLPKPSVLHTVATSVASAIVRMAHRGEVEALLHGDIALCDSLHDRLQLVHRQLHGGADGDARELTRLLPCISHHLLISENLQLKGKERQEESNQTDACCPE